MDEISITSWTMYARKTKTAILRIVAMRQIHFGNWNDILSYKSNEDHYKIDGKRRIDARCFPSIGRPTSEMVCIQEITPFSWSDPYCLPIKQNVDFTGLKIFQTDLRVPVITRKTPLHCIEALKLILFNKFDAILNIQF